MLLLCKLAAILFSGQSITLVWLSTNHMLLLCKLAAILFSCQSITIVWLSTNHMLLLCILAAILFSGQSITLVFLLPGKPGPVRPLRRPCVAAPPQRVLRAAHPAPEVRLQPHPHLCWGQHGHHQPHHTPRHLLRKGTAAIVSFVKLLTKIVNNFPKCRYSRVFGSCHDI